MSFSHEAPSGAAGCCGRTHLLERILFLSVAPGWLVLNRARSEDLPYTGI